MKQYEYKIPRLLSFIAFLFFAPMAWYGFHNASVHKDVTRHGVHLLTGTSATYFWVITSCIFLGLALLGIYGFIKSFGNPRFVATDDFQITAPTRPISNKILTIPYQQITDYKIHSTGKIRQLIIKSNHGKIMLADKNLNNKSDFDEIVHTISQKVRT